MNKKPELLLPVGTMEMALAAIHNGADAIFLGVPGFNARGRSSDFTIDTLREIISLCHSYRVKVNLAFNVLIFEEEITEVITLLKEILPLRPDALIIQDLGLVRLIRQLSPNQRVHASTQMTITNHEGILALEDLNIQRFVLGRENSIEEMKKIRENTSKELEVFVHGALCVSYSGQCFTSESLGGRSANRGQCAQSCRFSYEMYVDGQKKELGSKKYLVSPQDLCGIEEVPNLIEAGIDCFKIEGRLKTPEYVSTSAQAYRAAIDKSTIKNLDPNQLSHFKRRMAISYSRGFFSGWLHGVNHQKLVQGEFSSNRGNHIGTVVNIYKNTLTANLKSSELGIHLVPGDGLFWSKDNKEQGGFIYHINKISPSKYQFEFSKDLNLNPELVGSSLYQNHDKELKKEMAQSYEDKTKKKRLPIDIIINLSLHQPLSASISDGEFTVEGQTENILEQALHHEITDTQIHEEFNSLSGSLFKLNSIKINRNDLTSAEIQNRYFISRREIKKLRQQLIAELTLKRQNLQNLLPLQIDELNSKLNLIDSWVQSEEFLASNSSSSQRPLNEDQNPIKKPNVQFNLLLRDKNQVNDLCEAFEQNTLNPIQINSVILDFEWGRDYAESLSKLRSYPLRVGLATTRILKPTEYRNLKHLLSLNPQIILVRNLGAIQFLNENADSDLELKGDFSLNVTNHLTANYLFQKRLASLCLSYDLNYKQVNDLLTHTQAHRCEVSLFQYMPSFHMEHCVFAAFLSQGSSYRDCGKPCEQHHIQLKDQFQNWHQIKADQECRNTMYNARAQSAARFFHSWKEIGLGAVRFEALKERGDELILKIQSHLQFIQNQIDVETLIHRIGAFESYGLSEGAIAREREYISRKKFSSDQIL